MKKFRWLRAFKKGLLAAAAVGAGLVAGVETLGGLEAVQQAGVVGGVSALTMAIRVGLNWWKVNRDLANKSYLP